MHPIQFNALVRRRQVVEQRRAWPLALFASRWDRAHYETPLEPYQYIPGMTQDDVVQNDTPAQQIIDNFMAYDEWFKAQQQREQFIKAQEGGA